MNVVVATRVEQSDVEGESSTCEPRPHRKQRSGAEGTKSQQERRQEMEGGEEGHVSGRVGHECLTSQLSSCCIPRGHCCAISSFS